jgi:NADH dehydrogenase
MKRELYERKEMSYPKTIIIGAGFGGLEVAKRLSKTQNEVLLIDKHNHHLFQPLLYQVATCALSPGEIATPIRHLVSSYPNVSFIMGSCCSIDKENKQIFLECGMTFPFDTLVVATGARHSYFGNPQWEEIAPGLKTLQDAMNIQENVLAAFEKAERALTHAEATRYLRFAIVGAGPTGVELAGAIAEIAFQSVVKNFTKIRPDQTKIFLIEGAPEILPGFPDDLAKKARASLESLGVTVLTDHKVSCLTKEGVMIGDTLIEAPTVLWAAGNEASSLVRTLGTPLDRQGRAIVEQDLSIPGYSNIFVLGDAAHYADKNGKPLPGLAPVAKQQGTFVANIIKKQIPKTERSAFSYFDKGSLATIGKGKAVGIIGRVKLSGHLAWFIWSLVHIMYLVDFKNKLLVFIHWSYLYLTGKRSIQLIFKPIDEIHEE